MVAALLFALATRDTVPVDSSALVSRATTIAATTDAVAFLVTWQPRTPRRACVTAWHIEADTVLAIDRVEPPVAGPWPCQGLPVVAQLDTPTIGAEGQAALLGLDRPLWFVVQYGLRAFQTYVRGARQSGRSV